MTGQILLLRTNNPSVTGR